MFKEGKSTIDIGGDIAEEKNEKGLIINRDTLKKRIDSLIENPEGNTSQDVEEMKSEVNDFFDSLIHLVEERGSKDDSEWKWDNVDESFAKANELLKKIGLKIVLE